MHPLQDSPTLVYWSFTPSLTEKHPNEPLGKWQIRECGVVGGSKRVTVSLEKPGEPSVPDESQVLTASAVFDLLKNERRRCVIHFLLEQPETTVRELSRHVAAWENDIDVEDLEKQQRKRVYVSLYQTHVPKLEEAGLVEYDEETSVVSLSSQAGELDRFLGGEDRSYPWQYVYGAIAATGLVLVVLSSIGVPFFDALSPTSIAVAVTVVVAVAVVVHVVLWVRRSNEDLSELQYE